MIFYNSLQDFSSIRSARNRELTGNNREKARMDRRRIAAESIMRLTISKSFRATEPPHACLMTDQAMRLNRSE
jgi:hypothetical protein